MQGGCAALVCVALALITFLTGGTRLLFSLPSYGILAVAGLISALAWRQRRIPANAICLGSSAVFFGYVLVRALCSPVEYLARQDLLMVIGALMVYLLTATCLTAARHRLAVAATILVLGLVNVFIGVIQFSQGDDFMLFSFLQRVESGVRASGLYISPNHLAGFLEVAVVMGLGVLCWSCCKAWLKLVAGYAAISALAGIMLTGSRGGYLSTVFALCVFCSMAFTAVLQTKRGHFGIALLAAIAFAGSLALGAWFSFSHHDFLRQRMENLLTAEVRPSLWQAALKQFQLAPIVGTGSGTYLYYGRLFRAPEIIADPEYAHNDYLQLLAEFGIIGAAAFLLFLGSHVRSGWKAFRGIVAHEQGTYGRVQNDALALNVAALSAVAAYAAFSVTDFNLHIPANALLLAFVFGILANPGVAPPAPSPPDNGTNGLARLALPALGLWMATAGLPTLRGEYYAEKSRIALRDGRFADSIEFARQGIATERKNPYLYLQLGQAHAEIAEPSSDPQVRTRFFAGALEAFQKGLELFPQEKWMLLGAGSAMEGCNRPLEAGPFFQRAVAWEPNSAEVRYVYGAYLQRTGKLTEAAEQYRKSMEIRSTQAARDALKSLDDLRAEQEAGPPAVP